MRLNVLKVLVLKQVRNADSVDKRCSNRATWRFKKLVG